MTRCLRNYIAREAEAVASKKRVFLRASHDMHLRSGAKGNLAPELIHVNGR